MSYTTMLACTAAPQTNELSDQRRRGRTRPAGWAFGEKVIKIGSNERKILLKLVPGEFVPPSVYLGDFGSCPGKGSSAYTLNRIVYDKKLAIMQYQTWTPEKRLRRMKDKSVPPGRATVEINAAMMPTEEGLKVIQQLRREKDA